MFGPVWTTISLLMGFIYFLFGNKVKLKKAT
ncbi:MAG: hypothetical protein IPO72_11695 [Saprospiraceae bacterium]|nr:hypothetical protein [Candidatus Vicinibacter affinis]